MPACVVLVIISVLLAVGEIFAPGLSFLGPPAVTDGKNPE